MAIDVTKFGGEAFAQAVGQAKTAAEDFTRMFAQLRLPAVPDTEALLAAHRRNLETLSAANKIALEGAQAVAKRHMEIIQQTMAELSDSMRQLTATESPQARAARQTDLLKRAYERAVTNTRELGDLIQQANGEAMSLLNHRVTEALDEVKTLIEKSEKPG